jgi:hypothetical protein
MKSLVFLSAILGAMMAMLHAEVKIDEAAFGKSLGGWKKRDNQAAEYPLSGTTYRTYRPEVTPTPDGGIFISVRIDHIRGWLSSDDHAVLEITVNSKGMIVSAQSNIALQGRSISTDVILGTNEAGKQIAVGTDRAVQIGTDLVADLSSKLLREKIVEAGRVSFPSVLRHNYNLLFQAIRVDGIPVGSPAPLAIPIPLPGAAGPPVVQTPPAAPASSPASPTAPATPAPAPEKPKETPPATPPVKPAAPANAPLEIKPYVPPTSGSLPTSG